MTTPIQHPRCPICEAENANVPYPELPSLAECTFCSLLFRSDWREIAAPNAAYEEAQASPARLLADERTRGPYYEVIARRIRASGMEGASTSGTLLEIGCGAGGLLSLLRAQGWTVEGIEPSGPLQAHARAHLEEDVPVHRCFLEEADPHLVHRPYHAVIALDVIEHIPDPFLLPRKAAEWLAPGGLLILQTPNARSIRRRLQGARWEQLAPSEHFLIHSPRSLRLVLEKCGLKVVGVETTSGGAVDGPLRRALMRPVGRLLSLLDLGNALWAVAMKDAT